MEVWNLLCLHFPQFEDERPEQLGWDRSESVWLASPLALHIQFNPLSLSHPPYIIFNSTNFHFLTRLTLYSIYHNFSSFSPVLSKPHQNDQKTWHALFISFISMHCNRQGFTILSLFEGLYLGCDPPFNRGKPHSISRSRKVWIPWKVVNLCRSHIVQAEDRLNTSLFRFPSSWSFTCTRKGMIRPQTKKNRLLNTLPLYLWSA